MTFRNLVESEGDKVYFERDTLWVAIGQGSGTTSYIPDIKRYLTNNNDDDHYDSIVNKLEKFASVNKPLKANGKSKLFEIPFYETSRGNYRIFDVWGGDVEPIKKYYMCITLEKSIIVNFFVNKNEALNWINSIS